MDRYFNIFIKGYILNQITTLLSFCLLFSPITFALTGVSTADTSIPESSEIKELSESPLLPAGSPANSVSESSAVTPTNVTEASKPNASQAAVVTEINPYSNYLLSPGDVLNISVWKEEGLQEQQFLISPDGSIIYPLIGPVLAAGKTISELREVLSAKLADFISDPSITVKLFNNQGNAIFVIGKVNKPGQYFSGRKVDVLQAISLAGGLTVFANDNSISILRRVGSEIKVFPFDYSDVIKGEELQQNILLEPGDTVTVP
jgi:polysaccharide export outer membrane protein